MTPTPAPASTPGSGEEPNLGWALRQAEDALRGLLFGSVTLSVQDGVVIQVERTERRPYRAARAGERKE
jgi:hypothetical protein